jgi:hypothetical protein
MKSRTVGGMISALIFGVLFAGAMHLDHEKTAQRGREAFLAKEAVRFNRHFAKPDPIGIEIFVSVCMSGAVFGAYELVAFGVSKALRSTKANDENPG